MAKPVPTSPRAQSPHAYRVNCGRMCAGRMVYRLSEWHNTLASALEAMEEHGQRGWDSVWLQPVPVREKAAPGSSQLPLFP